jgi:hypothetical protein
MRLALGLAWGQIEPPRANRVRRRVTCRDWNSAIAQSGPGLEQAVLAQVDWRRAGRECNR